MPKYVTARAAKFADRMKFKRGKIMSSKRETEYLGMAKRRKSKTSFGSTLPEMKYLDNALGLTAQSGGTITSISSMAQGLTNITRLGNKIQIKSVEAKVFTTLDADQTHVGNLHRWMIVLDKNADSAIAGITEILEAANPLSMRNPNNSDRFVVLANESYTTGCQNVTVTPVGWSLGNGPQYQERFVNVDIGTKFNGTGATQASAGDGQLLFVCISYVTDANLDINVETRIRYVDA